LLLMKLHYLARKGADFQRVPDREII